MTRRDVDDALAIVDLTTRKASLVALQGLCPEKRCGEVAFNHGPINHGVLALRAASQVALFEVGTDGSLRKLGRWPLPAMWNIEPAPIAWSGDGSHLIVGTLRQNGDEFLVLKVTDGGETLAEARSLRGCPSPLGTNVPKMILTHNRKLERLRPAVPCVPPSPTYTATLPPTATATPTATSTPTATLMASATPTPSATPSPSETPSPTRPPTKVPSPIYLPMVLRESCTPEQRRVDVVLVLDASLSMLEPSAPGSDRNKLEAAREAARSFLDALRPERGDQAAIVAFNARATLLSQLTGDRSTLEAALAAITAAAQTCIVCGVEAGAAEMASARHRPEHAPVLILLTDGRSNPQPASEAVARAAEAKAAGIRVYTIGLGAELDEAALREMASGPGGYRHEPSGDELAGIYRGIAVDIPCPGAAFWGGR